MTALRNLRRNRGRRYVYLGATLVAAAVLGVIFVASSGASLATSPFEGGDGNMVVDNVAAGHTDWESLSAPVLRELDDVASGQDDNSFTGGSHEDDPNVTIATGSVPPNKNDLTRAYVASETISGETFLYLAWERQPNPNGSANIDFELDQNASAGDFTQPGDLTINRTEGDILITYDFGGSGTPDLGLLTWLTDNGTHTNSECQASGQKLPCWGNRIALNPSSNPPAEAGVNDTTIDEVFHAPEQLDVGTFGEAKIDLSAVPGLFTPGTCKAFGNMFVKSRSSGSSIDAELKDFIAPAPIQVTNCPTPDIATQTSVSSMSVGETQTVGDTATLTGGNNPTGDVTFTLYSDQTCTTSTGVTGTDTLDASGVATFAGASFTPTQAGTYYWGVTYPGDNNNNPASACGGPNEEIVVNAPSLSIDKTADAATVDAGDPIGFTITVSNGGPGTAFGVTLDDPLPTGTDGGWSVDSQTNAGQCSVTSGTLTCTAVDLGAGASFVVHVTAGTSFANCSTYHNTATAHADNAQDVQDSASIDCLAPAMTITKTADAATVDAGDSIGFTITVANGGPGTAKNVTLNDPLPTGTEGGWSVDGQSNAGQCSVTGGTLSCTAVDLAPGQSFVVHVKAGTSFANCSTYDNTATAHASNADPVQDSASIDCQKPALSIVKTADQAQVSAGEDIGFSITVSNGSAAGTGTAKNVTLTDPLPAGTEGPWSVDSQTNAGQCSVAAGALSCSAVDLAPGESFTVHVKAGTSFANCTTYDNTATAHASNADPVQDSASIECSTAELSITKDADAASVNAGDPIGFTISVLNAGPGTAFGVTVDDPLPAGTAGGWSIDSGPANCSISGAVGSQSLDCTAVDLAANDGFTVHITADTSFAACTTYDNTATAQATNAPQVEDSAAIVCNAADVSVAKTADHTSAVLAGGQIGFTVEVKNAGTGVAGGVSLNDPLPAGSGSGVTWAVDSSVGTPTRFVLSGAKGSQKLALASSTLPAGADYKVHLTAVTSTAACGTYDNTATLTTGNANNPGPASARESCRLPQIDLAVTKAGSPASQTLGNGNITWTMVVTNNGPDTATGVTVADPIPAGNTFVSATSSQGSCTGGSILHCSLGTMAAKAKVTITLLTTPTAAGTVTNTVTVVGNEHETTTANNSASASVQVNQFTPPKPVFCVAVSKVTPKQLFVGRKTKLKIRVTQHGKAVKGVHVRIKGPKVNIRTKASNHKGVITRRIKMKKAGVLVFSPIASKRCNTKRVGVTGVFTPPVTG